MRVTHLDRIRVQRRVKKLLTQRKEASGMGHLHRDERDRLIALAGGVRLATVKTEHQADEIAAALHDEMPWMGPATEQVWRAMPRSVREGSIGLRLPPILLDGPPGIGKSFWARRLGRLLTVPTTVIEATNENASFGVVGSQRGWGSAGPGRLISTILMEHVGNPVMVVDEVEKSGTATSMSGRAFGLSEALLPLLEPMTARSWSCPYYQVKFDMSWVIWVLTSNNYHALPEPLLSRCPPTRGSRSARQTDHHPRQRSDRHSVGRSPIHLAACPRHYRRADGPLDLLVDSTGIKFLGDGEWQARKHGVQGRRQAGHSRGRCKRLS